MFPVSQTFSFIYLQLQNTDFHQGLKNGATSHIHQHPQAWLGTHFRTALINEEWYSRNDHKHCKIFPIIDANFKPKLS
jgi:hypothetical protein